MASVFNSHYINFHYRPSLRAAGIVSAVISIIQVLRSVSRSHVRRPSG
jgi:hypothetical protein